MTLNRLNRYENKNIANSNTEIQQSCVLKQGRDSILDHLVFPQKNVNHNVTINFTFFTHIHGLAVSAFDTDLRAAKSRPILNLLM